MISRLRDVELRSACTYDIRPASMLRYGSTLILDTVRPNVFKRRPQLEAIMPFPTPEITPARTYQHSSLQHKKKKRKQKKGKNSPPETRIYFISTDFISNTGPISLAGNCQGRRGGRKKKKKRGTNSKGFYH